MVGGGGSVVVGRAVERVRLGRQGGCERRIVKMQKSRGLGPVGDGVSRGEVGVGRGGWGWLVARFGVGGRG